VTKIKRWVLPAVRVGAVSAGNLTLAGQVTVPEVCVSSKVNVPAVPLAGGLEKVNVELPLIVLVK
jgi:hypothetical protein